MVTERAAGVAAKRREDQPARADAGREGVMHESPNGAGPAMTPHEMLAASDRLGSHRYGEPVVRPTVPVEQQQYDESGFPIRSDPASLASRVRRLLSR
jgi:hypothetical protein